MAEGTNPLTDLRASIDRLDASLLPLLSERQRILEKILSLKKAQGLDLHQSQERKNDLQTLKDLALRLKLNPGFIDELFEKLKETTLELHQDQPNPNQTQDLSLDILRPALKGLEEAIILILNERFRVVQQIGHAKVELRLPPLDAKRWEKMMDLKRKTTEQLELAWPLVENLFNMIHKEALRMEEASQQP